MLIILTALMNTSTAVACTGGCSGSGCSTASVTFETPEASISADTLAGLMRSDSQITLLECRMRQQSRDLSIPGARIVFDDMSPENMAALVPATDSLIILYPGIDGGGVASVAASLRQLGYLSILEYHAGVYGWITYGYKADGDSKNAQ